MKQLLFTLILFLSGINILQAQETNSIEETTWNVIRERLFSGENSKAFRFEEDIRFQLKGEVSKEDSLVMQNIVYELKKLIEVVDVQLVNVNSNFEIIFWPENRTYKNTINQKKIDTEIINTSIVLEFSKLLNGPNNNNRLYYYIFKGLTNLFEPRYRLASYKGIFDPSMSENIKIHEIDKELIRKLYSNDFYEKLKENTVKNYGYLYYWDLIYSKSLKFIFFLFGIVFSILGFYIIQTSNIYNKKLKLLKDYFKIGYVVIFWIIVIYWFFTFPQMIKYHGDFNGHLINILIEICILGLICIPILFYSEHFLIKEYWEFFKKQVIIFLTTIISINLAFFILTKGIIVILNYLNLAKLPSLLDSRLNFFLITNIIATFRLFFNLLNYRIQSMVNQKDVELAKMKELKNQAELNALHSRINPHFLYNSLNSIAELAHINPDKTENMAVALSELFRYSINKENKTFVTVEEELEMVKKYLEIEKTRFGEKLNYTISVDETAKEKLIPKFLIQPLAENAIKHGLSKLTEEGKIIIEVKQLENDLVITIFDNGPDFPEEPVSGYGLQNLNDKLEIIYGNDAFINWENGDNKHFKITIKNLFKG